MAGINGIRYVRYQAPDLDKMEQFLLDFGLVRSARTDSALFMRGTGGQHHLHITELADTAGSIGVGLEVKARADLDAIAQRAGLAVEEVNEPGGGFRVVTHDPNGIRVEIVQGQEELDPIPTRDPLVLNHSRENRRLGSYQRPAKGPSHVARLEHAVLEGQNFEAACEFYRGTLGMETSDTLYADDPDAPIIAFFHCGLGEAYTDHHTIALAKGPNAGFHHAGFVTLDWDDLMLGHFYLKEKGYRHNWGIGRHILGSEIFDYWRDPFGNMIEHCCDGDMVNAAHEPTNSPLEEEMLAVWAAPPSEVVMPTN